MDSLTEETRLAEVRALIKEQIGDVTAELKTKRGGIAEARRVMSLESTVVRGFEDLVVVSPFMSDVIVSEQAFADAGRRLNALKRMQDSPYFGRIDFIEDGQSETEQIYIGGQSLFDEKNRQCLIYDWRAPISSMYYDYGIGRASFDAPDGVISGEIVLKRQYRVEGGRLVYMFDSDLSIDDDILQWELSKSSDAKIKTIINTIQREQNRAIRAEADNVLVFGPAGSGKTSAGLHRLAYLMYRHRGKLTSAGARILSSNNIFAAYIAGVIPELYEDDVDSADFTRLLNKYQPESRAFHGPYEQIEYLSAPETERFNPRRAGMAMKHSRAFAAFAAGYINQYAPVIGEDVYFNQALICEKARLDSLYGARTSAGNMASRTARVMEYVDRCYEEYFKDNKRIITDFFCDLYEDNFNDGEIRAKFDEQKNIVLNDLRNRLFPDTRKLYGRAVRAYVKETGLDARIINATAEALRRDKLFYEDALLMFYIDTVTGRVKRERGVKHILIDEAQDLSAPHHLILLNLFASCRFTVLADVNQALYPEINLTDKDTLTALYANAQLVELNKSYRSTFEIGRFAANLIDAFDEDAYFKRFGGEPLFVETENAPAAAADILAKLPENINTVGVLLSGAREAAEFYKALKPLTALPAALIDDPDGELGPGVTVMAVQYAKGLEFDAVIVPGYDALYAAEGRRVLYLMCTRALHMLYLLK